MNSGWSIRRRLFASWFLMLILVSVVVYWSANAVVERSLREGQDRNLQAVAQVILDSAVKIDSTIEFELPYQAFEVLAYSAPERIYYSVSVDMQHLSGYRDLPDSKASGNVFGALYRGEPTRFYVGSKPIFPGSTERLRVVIGQTETSYQSQSTIIAVWIAVAVLVAFTLLALWAELSLRNALKPVIEIEDDLGSREADDFTPIKRRVPSEVARLVQTLNRTFDQHRGLLEENRAFIAQATHRIKTPIAAILTRAELLEKEVDECSRDSVKDLIVRARYASKLATQVLLRATITYREIVGVREQFDLTTLVSSVLRTMDPSAEIKDVGLTLLSPEDSPVMIEGDRIAVREAITCLVDNAIEYTPPLSDIEVVVHEIDNEACVSVMDQGPGFVTDVAQISDFGTSKKDPSHVGLGLAIIERVAKSHGGRLTISSREGGGSRCVLSFAVS
jgi:two-component system sensor histidine kinase TctE